MNLELNRIDLPEGRKEKMENPLTEADHRITVYSKEQSVDSLIYSADGFEWDNRGRDTVEIEKVECECGYSGTEIPEAENHLQEMSEQGKPTRSTIRKTLEDIEIHNFEFNGFEGHGTSIVWTHQYLSIKLYATPLEELTGEEQKLGIQLSSIGVDTPFQNLNGRNTQKIDFTGSLSFGEYLKEIRDYIEENLLRPRWESKDSKACEKKWESLEKQDFIIELQEMEDGKYRLYSTGGISICPFETGSKQNLIRKAHHYMRENPLGLGHKSYQGVIEDSEEFDFTGYEAE